MTTDTVTFGLAWMAYALLATDFARRVSGQRNRVLTGTTAVTVIAHVACVYVYRFDGSLSAAWDKSPVGFLLFNSVFVGLFVAPIAAEPWRTRLVVGAFPVVSLAGLGAPFRYPELELLALPLFATCGAALLYAWRFRTKRSLQ